MEVIKAIFSWLKQNRGRIVLLIFSAIFFTFLFFPLGDLSDLVTAQVSKMTRNQVYLQFDDLNFSVLPQPGIAFDKLNLQAQSFPTIKAEQVIVTPSLFSLITQKPAGQVTAMGLMGGKIKASISGGKKSESGIERQLITLNAEKLSLAELKTALNLPVSLKGQISIDSTTLADLAFQEQPEMDVLVRIDRFELPPSNLQTAMGPMTLPDLKLSAVQLKGRLAGGRFFIEEGIIGNANDELSGSIKGNIGLQLQNSGGSINPLIGGYDFSLDLKVKKSFEQKSSLFLSFIDQYKTALPDGARYAFKLSAANPMMPPSFGALR